MRKRIIQWIAGILLVTLVALTVVSNQVYQASLPQVRTQVVEQEIGELLDGYGLWETFAWIPRECIFPSTDGSEDKVCIYRIRQRPGQFTRTEYYLDGEELQILDEREDAILVDELYLSFQETLVCETDLPLTSGQTVVWLNILDE